MARLIVVIIMVAYVFIYSACTVAKRADEQSQQLLDQVQQ